MSLFVLDTAGDQKLHEEHLVKSAPVTNKTKKKLLDDKIDTKVRKSLESETECKTANDDEDYFGLPPPSVDLTALINDTLEKTSVKKGKVSQALEDVSEKINAVLDNVQEKPRKRRKQIFDLDHSDFNAETGKFDDEQLVTVNLPKEMSQSKLKPGFEQLKALPSPGKCTLRRLNKIERAKTKGGEWYNLPATELTDEVKNELKILQMRAVLDPKHFYKKNDLKVLPKYFQIGTVLPSPLDYYNERDTRKNKKHTLVDDLLADTEFQTYNKRKFNEVMARKNKYAQRKVTKKMKKLKKRK